MNIPVGVDSFRQLVTDNADYMVDRTLFARDIIEDGSLVVLLTRPRCFVKTSNLSMLHHFLAKEVAGQETTSLFDGLAIRSLNEGAFFEAHQGQYPTVFLSLKEIKGANFTEALALTQRLIADCFAQHTYLQDSPKLSATAKQDFSDILTRKADKTALSFSLRLLTNCLYEHHGTQAYVLIDEYDTPFYQAYTEDYLEEMRQFLSVWLSAGLKSNHALKKAVLTGILRVAKESLFSDFNNPNTYTLFDERYSEHFGFTEAEVHSLLAKSGLDKHQADVARWYNGYQIGSHTIYNPWSVMSFISKHVLRPYWVNTSDNKLIKQMLPSLAPQQLQKLDELLQNKPVSCRLSEPLSLETLTGDAGFWSLLVMSGYLKPLPLEGQSSEYSTERKVALPNMELTEFFKEMLDSTHRPTVTLKLSPHTLTKLVTG